MTWGIIVVTDGARNGTAAKWLPRAEAARRFYFREGFDIPAFCFRKKYT
jgi:hypothetical protein